MSIGCLRRENRCIFRAKSQFEGKINSWRPKTSWAIVGSCCDFFFPSPPMAEGMSSGEKAKEIERELVPGRAERAVEMSLTQESQLSGTKNVA